MPIHLSEEDAKRVRVKPEFVDREGQIEWTYSALKDLEKRGWKNSKGQTFVSHNDYAKKYFDFIEG